MTEELANRLITDDNPGTETGSGRRVKEVDVMMLDMSWTKRWGDGAEATKQQLVSVIAKAPESVLYTLLVKT